MPAPATNPIVNGQIVLSTGLPVGEIAGSEMRNGGSGMRKNANKYIKTGRRVSLQTGPSATPSNSLARLTWLLFRFTISRASVSASITSLAPVRACTSVCAAII